MHDASSRLLPLAVVGEGGLAIAGGVWLFAAGHPVRLGATWTALASGVAAAMALALVQWWLQRSAPGVGPVQAMRELQRTIFEPLFAPLSVAEMVAISALAGIGEEILFRGAMQASFGRSRRSRSASVISDCRARPVRACGRRSPAPCSAAWPSRPAACGTDSRPRRLRPGRLLRSAGGSHTRVICVCGAGGADHDRRLATAEGR
jgi:hypothetical protein